MQTARTRAARAARWSALLALLVAVSLGLAAQGPQDRHEELMRRAGGEGPPLSEAELAELLEAFPPDQVDVNLVMIPVVVMDRKGRPVTGLTAADFRVYEAGRPQVITSFSEEADRPLRIALLVDVSGSMSHAGITEQLRTALLPLMRRVRIDRDKLLLLSFAGEEVVRHGGWNARPLTTLHRALSIPRGGRTALKDALAVAAGLMPRDPRERHAIVLVSDGVDNASRASVREVVDAARSVSSPVYVQALGGEARRIQAEGDEGSPLAPLRTIAVETGARFSVVGSLESAVEAAEALTSDLRHQYLLAYRPETPPDGSFRPIRVEIARRGLEARARQGYR